MWYLCVMCVVCGMSVYAVCVCVCVCVCVLYGCPVWVRCSSACPTAPIRVSGLGPALPSFMILNKSFCFRRGVVPEAKRKEY
jgi:hypothetical protein